MRYLKYYLLFSICVLITSITLLSSCSESLSKEITPSSAFTPYISGYSGGVQSVLKPITIELANVYPDAEPNKVVDKKLFSIEPSLKGNVVWKDMKTLQFIPTKALESNTTYEVNFHLGELYQLDSSFRDFKFAFRTKIADGLLTLKDFIQYNSSSDEAYVILNLKLSDVLDMSKLDKSILIKDENNKNIEFSVKSENPTSYDIEIKVVKSTQRRDLKVSINGADLGLDRSQELLFTIPAKDEFYVVQYKLINEQENGIEVVFSDALDVNQNIASFIEINGVDKYTSHIEDNRLFLYFEYQPTNEFILQLHEYIRSSTGKRLNQNIEKLIKPNRTIPAVSILSSGSILPDSKQQLLAFSSIGLEFLDLQVVKVYSSNMLSFLQTNDLSGTDNLKRSGRLILKKRIDLKELTDEPLTNLQSFKLDLSNLFDQEPGALYHIALSFRPEYTLLTEFIKERAEMDLVELDSANYEKDEVWDNSANYYYEPLQLALPYDWEVYDWKKTNDPTHLSFYMDNSKVSARTNVYSTQLGLIVKQNENNKLWVAVNDLLTTKPMGGVKVKVYSYQLQIIDELHTDKRGIAESQCKGVPYIVVAEYDKDKTYLKVPQGHQLMMSRFDVGGVKRENGLKGYIYGERGVWRPGDTMHINFILEDREHRIPENHPVTLELFNPRGQFYTKQLATRHQNGVYYFKINTEKEDLTGTWNAYIKIGGSTFHKALLIETIKPNRLKINLDFDHGVLKTGVEESAVLSANWLMGAVGSNLDAKIELTLAPIRSAFPQYDNYLFTELNSYYQFTKSEIFKGKLDGEGKSKLKLQMPASTNAPGLLKAQFITRVYEPGGDYSIHNQPMTLSPYSSYVGITLRGEESDYLETDVRHNIDLISVNAQGKPLSNHKLHYEIYSMGWDWWYSKDQLLASYVHNSSVLAYKKGDMITNEKGEAHFPLRVDYPNYGRYLVYVRDVESGHAVSQVYYLDWPSWRGRASRKDATSATMLSFNLDKKEYKVGDQAEVIIPAAATGRALVSIENGNDILAHEWIDTKEGEDTKYSFTVTKDMAPNVYVYVSLLQPHAQTINNSPIRMYGVEPLFVKDESTHIQPILEIPKVLEPEKTFKVNIKEESGKKMTYTLAIVDDGLLDLTSFKTPNPWEHFYSKEALGIQTWDMYDDVIGAISAIYTQKYRVGGDEILKPADAKANRFKPVVEYLGPYTLEAGQKATHDIILPMYVGSVRTMVVASNGSAFGSTEQTSLVRSPLMLISSLPRVLSISDEVWIPVNVFSMDDRVKEVKIQMDSSKNISVLEGSNKVLVFNEVGDKVAYFKVKVGNRVGVEKIKFTATSGTHSVTEEVEIEVRNPNPVVNIIQEKQIEQGQSIKLNYSLPEKSVDSKMVLEVSRMPSINLTNRITYLRDYYHTCTEQIISKALPLLFIGDLKEVSSDLKQENDRIIQQTIQSLYGRQLSDGSFVYWPGDKQTGYWVTAYAGLFLIKAQEKGYKINQSVLHQWTSYLSKLVRIWTPSSSNWSYDSYIQAYFLYVLSAAKKADLSAMNRLKEYKEMKLQSRWLLALSYSLIGKQDVAKDLLFSLANYKDNDFTSIGFYGSEIRDEAFILQTLVALDMKEKAFKQVNKLTGLINEEIYYQTQSTAVGIMALAEYAKINKQGSLDFSYLVNEGKMNNIKSGLSVFQKELINESKEGVVEIENHSKGLLYAQLHQTMRLEKDTLAACDDRGLSIKVKYTTLSNEFLDVQNLKRGTDVMAYVTVQNNTTSVMEDISLTHIIPSGWEIYHVETLLSEDNVSKGDINKGIRYQDIRDDRVLSYFDLQPLQSKTILVRLHATYAGEYVLPAIQAEQMYKTSVYGRTRAGKATVLR